MGIGKKIFWAAALPLGVAVHCEAGTPPTEPVVTVVVQNYAGVANWVLASAQSEASGVFGRAGIALRWVDCSPTNMDANQLKSCVPAVQPRIFLKILPESMAGRFGLSEAAFGLALGRQEAYIFAERVKLLALRKGVSESAILGYVMAHEMGHLLLGPGSHAPDGIMSADAPIQVFRDAGQGRLPTFTPAQVRQIHARLSEWALAKN
jgi:hypothetical protein